MNYGGVPPVQGGQSGPPPYNAAAASSYMVGVSNIAPNMLQHQPPFMMMAGMPQGFNPQPHMYMVPPRPLLVDTGPNMDQQKQSNLAQKVPIDATNDSCAVAPPQLPQHAVITKGPTQATSAMTFPTHIVPPLMDTLMNPVTVNLPVQAEEPVTLTNVVYVGGLHSGTSNEFIINMLQKCGKITHFKRHTDPSSGVLANFAFCDFESPSGAYYAMECLAGLPFGEGKIRISYNDKVKAQVESWKQSQLSELRSENPGESEERILEIFKVTQEALKEEFENLIKFEVMELDGEGSSVSKVDTLKANIAKPSIKKVETPKGIASRQESAHTEVSPSRRNTVSDLLKYTTRDYTINHKESHRRGKSKAKRREYDERFRRDEPEWIAEEAAMLRHLRRMGKIKNSTREKLIRDDLDGLPLSNPKVREREKELDIQDARAEAAESSADTRRMIPLTSTTVGQPVTDHPKKALPSVFSNDLEDEDEPMFTRKHRPLVKLCKSDARIWEIVPKEEEAVYSFPLDWDRILSDDSIIKLLDPWIRRCILEYMGDDDESLVTDVIEFLTSRLTEKPSPSELLLDVEQFLDDESKGFVLEMWRLLIFQHLKLLESDDQQ